VTTRLVAEQGGYRTATPAATRTPTPTATRTPTPAPGVVLHVGSASGKPGERVRIDVTLDAADFAVAGVQNDITFPPATVSLVGCVANPDINKNLTAFAPSVAGVRAIVASLDNLDPIPDGSVLYTCTFTIAPAAAPGSYRLINSHIVAASPTGGRLQARGTDGVVVVIDTTPTLPPAPTVTPLGPTMILSSTVARPGEQITFTARLRTAGAIVGGTQNDIIFDSADTPIAAKASGAPDCHVNPEIGKEATSFAFVPSGCTGTACTAVRALVFSLENTDPITDGSVLYTCTVNISPSATRSFYELGIDGVTISDPFGQRVPGATGTSGTIFVRRAEPTTTPPGPAIVLGAVRGDPGGDAIVIVTLRTGGWGVGGMQNDIIFDSVNAPIAAKASGKPDCSANPDINKEGTVFGFLPAGCSGTSCTSLRAIVISYENTGAIPDGSVLYTCRVSIAEDATAGTYPLALTNVVISSPTGTRLSPVEIDNGGTVIVGVVPPPDTVPTATATLARTLPATATASATAGPASGADTGAGFVEGDGGCQLDARRDRVTPVLLLPAVGLLLLRRGRQAKMEAHLPVGAGLCACTTTAGTEARRHLFSSSAEARL
jgi:hypothetical protein